MHDTLTETLAGPRTDKYGLGRPRNPQGLGRRFIRSSIHFFSYHLFLKRRDTRFVEAAGFRLAVLPTVFDPRRFLTSEFFAGFLGTLDLSGKTVADVGTGSGILALAAARAGAERVTAIDINPNAARAASENAVANGLGDKVTGLCSDLMAEVPAEPRFDVILSSPPSFPGEPRDVADRAWVAGPGYRDIAPLFEQARARLKPGGRMYVLFSSDSDLHLLGTMIETAGFDARLVGERSIGFEAFVLYELRPVGGTVTEVEPMEALAQT
ncbi:N5-glutamine methyltransferase, HemK family protein [Rhodovulum sp. PH10]|uniref:50S ribosomal protein L11 methyltransferase n=1 Tax=Rhodovulum sp. PH10 TaxID=1187851 RepID=UPI00027C26F7|nr:50S ribosomal protein L11 methyltransferase [Rhodovulum sp. PH10]EJW13732.1 N5-glutamine methyltransferase, HemK family protein [Rhodovulum sp. PH10]